MTRMTELPLQARREANGVDVAKIAEVREVRPAGGRVRRCRLKPAICKRLSIDFNSIGWIPEA